MSFRRVCGFFSVVAATLVCLSCGQVYRPVVIPINVIPPNSGNFHQVFAVNANVPFTQGTAVQFDVSGDTEIGAANMGVNPTHGAILPNNSRVFVASAGSLSAGDADVVTSFTPAVDSSLATGFGQPIVFTYPTTGSSTSGISSISEAAGGVVTMAVSPALSSAAPGQVVQVSGVSVNGYNGTFVISAAGGGGSSISYIDATTGLSASSGGTATVATTCSYQPDFVATAQTSAVFVANYGKENDPNCNLSSTDSVSQLNTTSNSMVNIGYLPAGSHPVAMVETPDQQNLYVLNSGLVQGVPTVTNLSPTDLSFRANIPVGPLPTWAALRPDGQRLYVVTQGDGNLATIQTATNTVLSTQSVGGVGANLVVYDKSRNRLYVANPGTGAAPGALYIFNATTDPPTPVVATGTANGILSIAPPPACTAAPGTCGPVMPVSVAALPDGSRFYVASYAIATGACPDPNITTAGCVIPQVTVFDAAALTVKTTIYPLLPPVASPASGVQPYALAPLALCVAPIPYTPSFARFRMSAAAAADSTRVYASMCDGGAVAVIDATTSSIGGGTNNTPDILVTALLAPFGAGPLQPNGEPLPQNPVFLFTGQ